MGLHSKAPTRLRARGRRLPAALGGPAPAGSGRAGAVWRSPCRHLWGTSRGQLTGWASSRCSVATLRGPPIPQKKAD